MLWVSMPSPATATTASIWPVVSSRLTALAAEQPLAAADDRIEDRTGCR
jgi:hypothetical protein